MPLIYSRVWDYLLMRAAWGCHRRHGRASMEIWVIPGMIITSMEDIAQGVSYYENGKLRTPNRKLIRDVLTWLHNEDQINLVCNANGTTIYIENWDSYQLGGVQYVTTEELDPTQQDNNAMPTIKEEYKKEKEDSKNMLNIKTPSPSKDGGVLVRLGRPDNPLQRTIDFYNEQFKIYHGYKMKFTPGKDAKLLKDLLRNFTENELRDAIVSFMQLTDDRFVRNLGWTMPAFKERVHGLIFNAR